MQVPHSPFPVEIFFRSSSCVFAAQLVSYWLTSRLADVLGENWRDLGRILGISERELEDIDIKNDDLDEKGSAMLVEWKNGRGDNATTKALQEALAELGIAHLLTSEGRVQCPVTSGNFNMLEPHSSHDVVSKTLQYNRPAATLRVFFSDGELRVTNSHWVPPECK